jgi:hypothetical protein
MEHSEAMEYLKRMHGEEAPQTSGPAGAEDTTVTEEQSVNQVSENDTTPVPESDAKGAGEPPETEVNETAAEDRQQPKKKPSKQEQINHAFQRQNRRHKAEIEAKDKRIAELEEKVKKYSVLEQGDFDPNDVKSYIDHKLQLNKEEGELERLKGERERLVNEDSQAESAERHSRQVAECFADDESRQHYWNLLRNGGQKFQEFLKDYDPDGSVDAFLGDSAIAPLMISTLMRNPETLKSIVEMRNPMRKMLALQQLENRLQLARKVGKAKDVQKVGNQKPTKAPLPIIGSQVQTPGGTAETRQRDWNRYLIEHPL